MSVQLGSTTDTAEAVTAALGSLAPKAETVEPKKSASAAEEQQGEINPETSENSGDEELEQDDAKEGAKDDPDKSKKRSGFKRRIDKLNAKVSKAEQDAEYWRQEALKAQPKKEATAVPEKKATGKPNADDFASVEEYHEALTDWKVDQKLTARDTEAKKTQLKTEHQKSVDAHVKRVEEFKENHEDFDSLMEDVDDIPMSAAIQTAILESENGAELMYELAKNREEYERIAKLPSFAAQSRELGKFEARLEKAEPTEAKLKTTKAPTPIRPVSAKSAGSGKKTIFDEDLPQHEYERMREAKLARRA